MRLRLALLGTVAALAAVPASAQATVPINDNYLPKSVVANQPGSVFPHAATVQWGVPGPPGSDTTGAIDEATTQANLGDPATTPENLTCPGLADMDRTVWYWTFPDVSGWIQVRTSGGDAVIRLIAVAGNNVPNFNDSACADDPSDLNSEELFAGVVGGSGRQYAVQVGVFDPSGAWAPNQHLTRITFFRDRDLDGLFDPNDRCPTQVGPAGLQGCADRDGDNVVDIDDRCPTSRGPAGSLRGCPDGDRDGIADIDDRCRTENSRARDANGDGCLDPLRLDRTVIEDIGGISTATRYRIVKFAIRGVPSGARISARCSGPKRRGKRRRSCGKQTIRRASVGATPKVRIAKTRKLKRFIGKRLRRGSVITIRVTANNAIGRYIRITIVRKGRFLGKKTFRGCMNRGARTKFKRRGCR